MDIAIIGLPMSGKTTVFNALTHGKAQVGGYAAADVHIGTVKVADPRLEELASILHPGRVVPAEIRYLDIPYASSDSHRQEGFAGKALNVVAQADALMAVIATFDNPAVPHPLGSTNPKRDMDNLREELAFSDLLILERRQQRTEAHLRGARGMERDNLLKEQAEVAELRKALEGGKPVRELSLSQETQRLVEGFQLLTSKPILFLINIGEKDLPSAHEIERDMTRLAHGHGQMVAALCGQVEMELAQLEPEDARELGEALGLKESGLERIVRLCYEVLGLESFFTTVSNEVRAWPVPRGATAQKAAGRIHSDMERGFIRAEVIAFQDLKRVGSIAEARKHGLLRAEGKSYAVQDGDVITFLFNV